MEQNQGSRHKCVCLWLTAQGSKPIKWGFSKRHWDNWISISKRMKLDLYITVYTKNHIKWIKDLNLETKTIELLEENTGVNLSDFRFENGFLKMTKKYKQQKKKNWIS